MWSAARQAPLCSSISWNVFKFMSFESGILSNHLILCHPLFPLLSVFPSIRVFSYESTLHIRWPKDWSFCFSSSPSNKYSGIIFFRIDCFDLPADQRTFESLLQHHSLKGSILLCSAFFVVQLSHLCMTMSAVILKLSKIKYITVSVLSPSIYHEVIGPDHKVTRSLHGK